MSALAGRPFLKMNGIGNEIIVLDLRGGGPAVSAAEARAIARGEGLAYDQLMVLSDPRTPGAEAYMTIFNNDGSESGACGNGTRCVAWALTRADGRERVVLETQARPPRMPPHGARALHRRHGRAAARLARHSAGARGGRHDGRRPAGGGRAGRRSAPSTWAIRTPMFFVEDAMAVDLARIGPALEHASDLSANAPTSPSRR